MPRGGICPPSTDYGRRSAGASAAGSGTGHGTWRGPGCKPGRTAAGLITREINVDSTICRAHQHAAGARRDGQSQRQPPGGNRTEPDDHGLGRSRRGWTTKIHLACEQGQRPFCWSQQESEETARISRLPWKPSGFPPRAGPAPHPGDAHRVGHAAHQKPPREQGSTLRPPATAGLITARGIPQISPPHAKIITKDGDLSKHGLVVAGHDMTLSTLMQRVRGCEIR